MCGAVPCAYRRSVDVLNDLILAAAASPWLLLVMFAVAALDGLLPPVPSETVLVAAAAVAASTGDLSVVVPLAFTAAAGAVVGDNLAYALGRRVGVGRFRWMRRPRVAAAFARASDALDRRGAPLILGARYIPVGRVAVNMSAGALGYPWRRFLPLSVLGGLAWAAYGAGIGVLAGQRLEDRPLLGAAIGIVVAVVLGVVVDRLATARRRHAGPAAPAHEDHDTVLGADEPELCATGPGGLRE